MFEAGNQLAKGRGRPTGSKNKLGRDFMSAYEECQRRGSTHPLLRMLEIANDPNTHDTRRNDMLLAAASYICPKPKQKMDLTTQAPLLTTAEEGESYLAQLIMELASELEPIELASMIRAYIRAKRDGQELQLKQIEAGASTEVHVKITGGLPELPGTNVILPGTESGRFNGHGNSSQLPASNGHAPQDPGS
jgi:hypothetical protein